MLERVLPCLWGDKKAAQPGQGARHAPLYLGVLLLGVVLLGACRSNPNSSPSATLTVGVSIPPQRAFVERIGGDRVDVIVLVLPGESPATYEPSPAQLRALSEADAYLSIGVPFEKAWLPRIASANPDMRVVDTTTGIQRMGSPENPDPHVWLSPALVKAQAETICDALAALDPDGAAGYRGNLDGFLADVDALDAEIRQTMASARGRSFMVVHPSWGYFARDYGLTMIAIEVGGQEPSAAELSRLVEKAKREQVRAVFVQPQFSQEAAETVAKEIDGEVVVIDPLAEDWGDNLRRVAQVLARHLDS